jgi:hypothetical protein
MFRLYHSIDEVIQSLSSSGTQFSPLGQRDLRFPLKALTTFDKVWEEGMPTAFDNLKQPLLPFFLGMN